MIVSRKMIEAFLEFVSKADAGKWDDEIVDLEAEAWETMRNVLENRGKTDYYSFLQDMTDAAQHSIRMEINRR